MPYVIEILSIGGEFYTDIGSAAQQLNAAQSEFQFNMPPARLKSYGLSFSQEEYHTDDIFALLEKYRREAKGNRPFLIAVVDASLRSKSLSRLLKK